MPKYLDHPTTRKPVTILELGRATRQTTMPVDKRIAFLVHQFLQENKITKTAHMLEQECGLYFDTNYFREAVLCGRWEELESYISGFIKIDKFREDIFFMIWKQQYLELLYENKRIMALKILKKLNGLQIFTRSVQELTLLLNAENLSDAKSDRDIILKNLQSLCYFYFLTRLEESYPSLPKSALAKIIKQCTLWSLRKPISYNLFPGECSHNDTDVASQTVTGALDEKDEDISDQILKL